MFWVKVNGNTYLDFKSDLWVRSSLDPHQDIILDS